LREVLSDPTDNLPRTLGRMKKKAASGSANRPLMERATDGTKTRSHRLFRFNEFVALNYPEDSTKETLSRLRKKRKPEEIHHS